MSGQENLRDILFERFRIAFGNPHRVVEYDCYWSLRPFSCIAAISVLVNGKGDYPLV